MAEPLTMIAADDPMTCAIYAREKGLLDEPDWKRFKGIAKRDKKMPRQVNQENVQSFGSTPKYQYGYEVPQDYVHAMRLDTSTPDGYKKIRVHLVFMIKHDGHHKSRLVANGHPTDMLVESINSEVVSVQARQLMVSLAKLNGLEVWVTDIDNAYLEAKTQEKCYNIAGHEFDNQEGHTLVVYKALYGLTGRVSTGILDVVISNPLDWYWRKQATVKTVTYSSEFVVPIYTKADMFGDNKLVVNSSWTSHAKLHKRHNALSFHRVQEAVAMKIIGYYHHI